MTHITLADVRNTMKQVVADNGESRVDYTCRYYDTAEELPGCIVGHVLARLGVSIVELAEFDARDENSISAIVDSDTISFTIDDEAAEYLNVAQVAQDFKKPWGEALREAEAIVV